MGIKRKAYFAGAETVLLCKAKYKDISLQARKIDNLFRNQKSFIQEIYINKSCMDQ